MRFEKVKKDAQLVLKGISFETAWHDGSLQSVTMRDDAGNVLKLAVESYSFYALVPAAPKMVKRYKVSGTLAGLPVEQFFEYDHETQRAKDNYESRVRVDGDADLSISIVEVPEDTAEPSPEIPF
jgi:hypothetical protein